MYYSSYIEVSKNVYFEIYSDVTRRGLREVVNFWSNPNQDRQ
jgi:hypothetical protein